MDDGQPPHVTVAALVRDELDRYLPSALAAWSTFADTILVLDNGSTDGLSAEWCAERSEPIEYRYLRDEPVWGEEVEARARLWAEASALTPSDGWIFVLDADMVPAKDPRPLLQLASIDAIAFNLYDLWAEDDRGRLYHRSDGFWRGHDGWRTWALRPRAIEGTPRWPRRGIHCGHFPLNLEPQCSTLYAPRDHGLLHYAYLDERDRHRKIEQYLATGEMLTEHEAAHAQSITDPDPALRPLPFEPELRLERAT